MEQERKIRWGIVGCGDVTEKKSGPGFQKTSGPGLVAVMRRNGAKAEDYARRHGVPRWYTEADRLINDEEVDATAEASGALPWRLNRDLSGGGLILDVGSHGLDLLDFYYGPLAEVSGLAGNQSGLAAVDDTVSGSWVFESGIHGSGSWCFSSWTEEDTIEIVGTRGKLSFSVLDVPSPITVETEEGVSLFTYGAAEHVQQPLIQMVVNGLRGVGSCPSTGASAMRTDAVLQKLRRGR